jgi:HPt (histidine-containing phosphotransfer) domain-containing protein
MEKPNTKYIDELAENDIDFRNKIIEILKTELPQEITTYNNLIENNDLHNASLSVHKLKHKISILGLEKSYYIAEEFEKNLRKHNADLHSDFNNILTVMMAFVNQL